jgi:hypothetical protein
MHKAFKFRIYPTRLHSFTKPLVVVVSFSITSYPSGMKHMSKREKD